MALGYCFEASRVPATLSASKRNDLAVVDTEGRENLVRAAVKRGVWVYGYLNVGALEKERPYYEKLKHLRLAKYEGWSGEYWIDPTAKEWQDHVISLAKQIKACGAIGLYLDNTDIYYMLKEQEISKQYSRILPTAQAVYTALSNMILKKKQSAEDTKYYTEYLDWCRKKGIYIRGIEYPKTKAQSVHAQLYYKKHRWQVCYISWHKDLRGD